jgi:glycosyltransferase involved in cell wall biosynthesis
MDALRQVDLHVGFDVFHGFFLPMAYPCVALPGRGARPVIASIRGDDAAGMLEGGPYLDAIAAALRESSWVTSVSSDSLHRVQRVADVAGRSSFIPNSISPPVSARWEATAENEGVVGTVCTFRPKKDVPTLIQAYGAIPEALRRQLLLVGDYFEGDTFNRQRIEDAMAQSGAAEDIQITGYVENRSVPEYLRRMRVFVLSSLHEGFPNTILEAASLGVPVVATAVDGVKDIYGDGDAALLVPPGDPAALAQAVSRVLGDAGLAARLSEASLETAARFSYVREQEAWVSLYQRLIPMESELFY